MSEVNKSSVAETFASRLSEVCGKGETKALSDVLNCTTQAVSQFKSGISVPKIENLVKIARHYGVSTDWLLGISKVRSVDENVKIACETTKISQESVLALSKMDEQSRSVIERIIFALNTEF